MSGLVGEILLDQLHLQADVSLGLAFRHAGGGELVDGFVGVEDDGALGHGHSLVPVQGVGKEELESSGFRRDGLDLPLGGERQGLGAGAGPWKGKWV